MFNAVSKTYTGALATLLASVSLLNEAEALNLVNGALVVVTTLFTLYGRHKAGGVDWTGMRTTK